MKPDMDMLRQFYKNLLDKIMAYGAREYLEPYDGNALEAWLYRNCNAEGLDDIYICNGAEKIIIYEDTMDYVLKINKYLGAENNACEREVMNYLYAEEQGVEEFFAWSDFLFKYEDILPVYIMEKVDCDEELLSSEAFDSAFSQAISENNMEDASPEELRQFREEFLDDYYSYYNSEDQMVDLVREQFGSSYTTFWNFCRERDINDLHAANFGYIQNRLVVVDYSGYHG